MQNSTLNRRQFLKIAAAGSVVAALPFGTIQAETSKQNVHIVIMGCGLAGLAAAHRLRRQLPNAQITIIDGKREHHYQPGFTLLATGVWHNAQKVKADNAKLIPHGVKWLPESVQEIQPDNQMIITHSGKVHYDYLIVATGLRLGYEKIDGFEITALGQKGLGSVYYSPEAATATWQSMDIFRQKGGRAVMTLAPTDMKCAGAPLKMTFMVADRIRQAGTAKNSQIDFFAAKAAIFSVKPVADKVLELWQTLEVPPQVHYHHELAAVDMDKQIAYFRLPETGGETAEQYDFLHIVPPMFAPDVIFNNNELANENGWLNVHTETLQHKKYPNIFGLGDVNGTPRGKTAATVKKSTPVVVHNLIRVINGLAPDALFDGYTSCPMLVREGEAMLVEFNGKGELTPTLPLVNPLQPSYFAWYLEDVMLKPAYMTVLRGRA